MLVEPVSGAPRYPLLTAADVVRGDRPGRRRQSGVTNVEVPARDLYHLAVNGDDVDAAIETYADRVGHVQIADAPGRGEPGTGDAATSTGHLAALAAKGYGGCVGLEYKPTVGTRGQPRLAPARRPRRRHATSADAARAATRRPHHWRRSSMTTVAFIGLGIMGGPMAGHLVERRLRRRRLQPQPSQDRRAGRRPAARAPTRSPRRSREADVVAVMVPDSPDVREVLAGEGGVFDNAKPGTLIIDFSSIRPDVTAELAEQATRARLPASWTPRCPAARPARSNATLSIMVGGDGRGLRRRAPSPRRVGKTIVHVGPTGSGQTVKAANQLIVAGNIQLLAEAVVFLEAYGVDTEAALEVLGGGLAGSAGPGPEGARTCSPATSSPASGSTCTTRTWASSPPPPARPAWSSRSARSLAQLMASAVANGDGGLDHSALLRGVERLSGQDPDAAPDRLRPAERT